MAVHDDQIREDHRFRDAAKEMKITLLFWLCSFLLALILSYSLLPAEPSQPALILGLPVFVFWAGIFAPVIVVITSYVVGQFVFQNSSLDAYEEGEPI